MCTVEKAKAFYLDRHGEPGGIRLSYAWAATCTLRCSAPYAYSGLCKIQIRGKWSAMHIKEKWMFSVRHVNY